MDRSVYTRPAKRKYALCPERTQEVNINLAERKAPVIVHADTQCHVTPMSVAERMVDYLCLDKSDLVLEPSAGTGNLVQALINSGHPDDKITAVEQNHTLWQALSDRTGCGLGATYQHDFLAWAEAHKGNDVRFDAIIMNPPFKHVKKHMAAAMSLLRFTGKMIALVPVTYEHHDFTELERLPVGTFGACKVHTKIIEFNE